jgi:hypothetical protein
MLCGIALPAAAAPLAETLAGAWTCIAKEGESNVAMTLNYRRSYDWLIGEITEDNGAALLDVWFDDFGGDPLAQRRILSNDATIEMKLIEEAPTWMKLEGELRHILGTTAHVREEIRFTGRDEFRAIWEADNGDGWQLVLDRSCKRI